MPPFTVPSRDRAPHVGLASSARISCFASSSTPSTSVSRISFSAASASAIAPAAVSAFTLYVLPVGVDADRRDHRE